jgi:hypothetical protein
VRIAKNVGEEGLMYDRMIMRLMALITVSGQSSERFIALADEADNLADASVS